MSTDARTSRGTTFPPATSIGSARRQARRDERAEALDVERRQAEPPLDVADPLRRVGAGQRRRLRVDRVDALDGALRELVDPGAGVGRHHAQLAVEEDGGRLGELVDQGAGGVGRHVRVGQGRLAAGNERIHDLDRVHRVEPLAAGRRQHVREARRRAHRDRRRQAPLAERLVELVLGEREVEEAAEVRVVRAGLEARLHDGDVEPVAGGVDDGVDALDRRPQVVRDRDGDGISERLGELPRALLVEIDDPSLLHALAARQIGDGHPPHPAGPADDSDSAWDAIVTGDRRWRHRVEVVGADISGS